MLVKKYIASRAFKSCVFVLTAVLLLSGTSQGQKPNPATEKKQIRYFDCKYLEVKPLVFPKPVYPASALYVRASGRVDVAIKIDPNGNVVEAKATSGHPLLWEASVKAAMNSKFVQTFVDGEPISGVCVLTYNYSQLDENLGSRKSEVPEVSVSSFEKSKKPATELPFVNGMASYLPKPIYPQTVKRLCIDGKVEIEVLISKNGNVLQAKAISGNHLFFASALKAAKKARFRHIDDVPPAKIRGILVYNFQRPTQCTVSYLRCFRKNDTILYPS